MAKSCLTYLLDKLSKCEDFTIMYNGDHCIGVSEFSLIERESNAFKKSLLSGELFEVKSKYLILEQHYSFQQICDTFNLDNHYSTILKQYYGKRSNS